MDRDFTIVTEIPGIQATAEQMERLQHRYNVATPYCEDKRVLEVACGSGIGLGYLAKIASRTVGGDYMNNLVRLASSNRRDNLEVLQLDAHGLPFKDNSFDTIILFEALYYLQNPEMFIRECHRVVADDGVLVVCTVNKEWSGFNPSPFSTRYFSAAELKLLLAENGFDADIFAAFPAATDSVVRKTVSLVRKIAVTFHLIPRSMKGKEFLKRLFYGRLKPLPSELENSEKGVFLAPVPDNSPASYYKILYAIGHFQPTHYRLTTL